MPLTKAEKPAEENRFGNQPINRGLIGRIFRRWAGNQPLKTASIAAEQR
jgi:hypothetical protein